MVGLALDKGYIGSIDDRMLDFFPDVAWQVTDPRKKQITIRNMLEMRAGYPWEEENAAAWEARQATALLPGVSIIILSFL